VRGRVVRPIGFSLHDDAAHPVEQEFDADQVARDNGRGAVEEVGEYARRSSDACQCPVPCFSQPGLLRPDIQL
jgi:hypothetical protein